MAVEQEEKQTFKMLYLELYEVLTKSEYSETSGTD